MRKAGIAPKGGGRRARDTKKSAGPDFSREIDAYARLGEDGRIVGVDEVGRGPFAGPVLAAAAWLSPDAAEHLREHGLDDSKRLSAKKRGALSNRFAELERQGAALGALGAASVREIETLNILGATELAMRRAIARFSAKSDAAPCFALIDGNRAPRDLPCPAETVIGGDGASLSIAAAALIAKESRDRLMRRLALRYPPYAWDRNAGYGSAPAHRAAILSFGLTPHHRRVFCRRLLEEAQARAEGPKSEEKTGGSKSDGGKRDGRKRPQRGPAA